MTELYVAHERTITSLAAKFFPNTYDAEDAVQEANLKLSRVEFVEVDNEAALVYTVVSNLFRDIYNKDKRQRDGESSALLEDLIDEDDPLSVLERHDEERFLEKKLSDLPADISTVASMYYYEGKSYKQIAAEFGIPEGTVASRLNTARRFLIGEE